jgi:transposase
MQMETMILGIDVAKATLDVALIGNRKTMSRQFENTTAGYEQMESWLKKYCSDPAQVCLEATGQYGDGVAAYLYQQGHSVSVVNPARIKHYANSRLRRNKTDKADAQLIAEYCQRETPALWTPPPASFKDLQALVRHLDGLFETRQQEVKPHGGGKPQKPDCFSGPTHRAAQKCHPGAY